MMKLNLFEENELFTTLFPNTELGIDLKFYTHQTSRLDLDAESFGSISRDGDDHYTFVEFPKDVTEFLQNYLNLRKRELMMSMHQVYVTDEKPKKVKRNKLPYTGKCLNVSLTDDGRLLPHFKRFDLNKVEDIDTLVNCIVNDIYLAYYSLVEEERPMART